MRVAVQSGIRNGVQALDETIPEWDEPAHAAVNGGARLLKRGCHAHYRGDILCSRTFAALLSAAVYQTFEDDTAPCVKNADPLWTTEFVRRDGEHINMLLLYVYAQMPCRLHGVSVENYAPLCAQRANLGYGLYGAYLVVGVHYRDQARVVADRGCKLRHVNDPV